MDEAERLETTEWLIAYNELIEQTRSLGETILNMTTLAETIEQRTQTPEVQQAARQHLAAQQLATFPNLIRAHQGVPYIEILERHERASSQIEATAKQLAAVENSLFEEAATVRADAAFVGDCIPELREAMEIIADQTIGERQQKKYGQLEASQQETAHELELLDNVLAGVGFIPLPMLATPEQQREAYRTARAIMAGDESIPAIELPEEGLETETWERGPGWRAGNYLARHAGERLALADVAQATYGPDDERAAAKLNALIAISLTSPRSPLKDRLAESGLTLRYEKEPLEDPGRRRYRYFVSAFQNEPGPAE